LALPVPISTTMLFVNVHLGLAASEKITAANQFAARDDSNAGGIVALASARSTD
jgi:hypothetical protein